MARSDFENAVDAVIEGDLEGLARLLDENPDLVGARSEREHGATLLHYLAANGVEDERQKTAPNAVEIGRLLLDRGAEVDALADLYEAQVTPLSMLLSSQHPADAGVQVELAELFLDHGAEMEAGPGTRWHSALMTALDFGYPEAARMLLERGARVDSLNKAAALGRIEEVRRWLPGSDPEERSRARYLARYYGHDDVLELLQDGEG